MNTVLAPGDRRTNSASETSEMRLEMLTEQVMVRAGRESTARRPLEASFHCTVLRKRGNQHALFVIDRHAPRTREHCAQDAFAKKCLKGHGAGSDKRRALHHLYPLKPADLIQFP